MCVDSWAHFTISRTKRNSRIRKRRGEEWRERTEVRPDTAEKRRKLEGTAIAARAETPEEAARGTPIVGPTAPPLDDRRKRTGFAY